MTAILKTNTHFCEIFMNKFLYAFVAIAVVFLAGCQNKETEISALETQDQKLSYAVGIQFGSRLKQDFKTLDFDAFSQGIQHAFGDIEPILSEDDMVDAFKQYKQKRTAEESAKNETSSAKNVAEGKAFLEAKAKEERVTVLTAASNIESSAAAQRTECRQLPVIRFQCIIAAH